MRNFALTMLAALAILGSSAITQVAMAMEPREVALHAYEMAGTVEPNSEAIYAGIASKLPFNYVIPNSKMPKTSTKGWVYRNPVYKYDRFGYVESIHVEVYRHVIKDRYEGGDKAKYGLAAINYSGNPKIVYDAQMSPLSDTGHKCWQTTDGDWLFRIGNTSEYWQLETDGRVRPYQGGTPVFLRK